MGTYLHNFSVNIKLFLRIIFILKLSTKLKIDLKMCKKILRFFKNYLADIHEKAWFKNMSSVFCYFLTVLTENK